MPLIEVILTEENGGMYIKANVSGVIEVRLSEQFIDFYVLKPSLESALKCITTKDEIDLYIISSIAREIKHDRLLAYIDTIVQAVREAGHGASFGEFSFFTSNGATLPCRVLYDILGHLSTTIKRITLGTSADDVYDIPDNMWALKDERTFVEVIEHKPDAARASSKRMFHPKFPREEPESKE